jgi:hypothetical protein
LVDRRFASHPKSRHGSTSHEALICFKSESTAQRRSAIDLEIVISRHFIEKYYGFLLLPNCHRSFHDGWISEIQELMTTNRGLRYSVFANAASHIHNIDTHQGMQSLALQYYSKSIRELSDVLDQANNPCIVSCNGFLTSVMLLYLHGVGILSSTATLRCLTKAVHGQPRQPRHLSRHTSTSARSSARFNSSLLRNIRHHHATLRSLGPRECALSDVSDGYWPLVRRKASD